MNEIPCYKYLQTARNYASAESYRCAFKYYLKAMENYPRVRRLIEFEVRVVLVKLNEYYTIIENNKPQIMMHFQSAMKAYPGNVNLLSDIGNYLFQYSSICEALVHFERALQIDCSLVTIEKSLDMAKKIIFPRAHYRLLNDARRNNAYLEAIRGVVLPNAECVLDIDTGVGLSALYARACAAASTAACDPSATMAKLAERVVTDNNVQEVLIVNKPATKLNLNDVYGERTLLITNKFDAGLFGGQLLQTLKHSWENLLTEYGRVIPGKAEYYVMGAKCDRIARRYQLGAAAKKMLNVPDWKIHTERSSDETYYGEDVNLYDDIEYVTEAEMLLSINFNDYYDITRRLQSTRPNYAFITATKDTEVNVLVGWFKLYLSDGVTLTNDPRSPERSQAWQQALFFDFMPTYLKNNETTRLQFYTTGGKLKYVSDEQKNIIRLSPTAIAYLNDTEYMETIAASISTASIYLGQIIDASDLEIADLCPFPLFGMQMMKKRGARRLLCVAHHDCDRVFIEKVFIQNNIPLTNVTILHADCWNDATFRDQMYHAIFCNALDLNGDIEVRLGRILQHLQYSHLARGGLVIPAKTTLVGQLISSEWLERQNVMSDEVVTSFKLANHVNLFQLSQANCIDPTRLKYEPLSDPVVLADCCHKMKSEVSSITVMKDGICNGILCWYEVQLLEHDESLTTKRSNCFVDSSAFLPRPRVRLSRGDSVSLIRCVDCDGSYKVAIDVDIA